MYVWLFLLNNDLNQFIYVIYNKYILICNLILK